MSIYTDEGVPMMPAIELAIRDHVEGVTTWPANEDGSEITVALQGGTWLCTIKPSGASFEVLIERGECVRFYSKLSHILARVRELAEAARDKPKISDKAKLDEHLRSGLSVQEMDQLDAPEPAPAEPTLREFLVEFRKWVNGEDGISVLADWLDARLGKEESDG